MRAVVKPDLALLGMLTLLAAPARADDSCKLIRVAALDIAQDSYGGVTVPAAINEHDVRLLVDTGG